MNKSHFQIINYKCLQPLVSPAKSFINIMTIVFSTILLFTPFTTSAESVSVQPEDLSVALQKILSQSRRPTTKDINQFISQYFSEDTNPNEVATTLIKVLGVDEPVGLDADLVTAAKTMSLLELYFPGYTLAPLGRDSLVIPDIIDAYFASIRQLGRVTPIELSSSSFNSPDTMQFLKSYLQSLGIDADRFKYPVILYDRTSFGENSQSTALIKKLVQWAQEAGIKDAEIPYHLNVLSTSSGRQIDPQKLEAILNDQAQNIERLNYHESSLMLRSPTDDYYWHNTFSALKKNETGQVIATPGQLLDIGTRKKTLARLIQVWAAVRSPAFLEILNTEFSQLNIQLSPYRSKVRMQPTRNYDDTLLVLKKIKTQVQMRSLLCSAFANSSVYPNITHSWLKQSEGFYLQLLNILKKGPPKCANNTRLRESLIYKVLSDSQFIKDPASLKHHIFGMLLTSSSSALHSEELYQYARSQYNAAHPTHPALFVEIFSNLIRNNNNLDNNTHSSLYYFLESSILKSKINDNLPLYIDPLIARHSAKNVAYHLSQFQRLLNFHTSQYHSLYQYLYWKEARANACFQQMGYGQYW